MSDLTPALARYVLSIRDGAERRVQLAERLAVSKPSVTKAVDRLEDLGLVTEDGRRRLSLTDEGVRTARALSASVETVERCLVDRGMPSCCVHRFAQQGALAFEGCAPLSVSCESLVSPVVKEIGQTS